MPKGGGKGGGGGKAPREQNKAAGKPVLGPTQKKHVAKLKEMGVEDPRKFFLAGKDEGYTWKAIKSASQREGSRNEAITENPIYAGTRSGGSNFSGGPPDRDAGVRPTGGGVGGSPGTGGAPAFFDSGGGAGGGAGGGNPLTSGGSGALDSGDLEHVLHGAKRKGRVKRARGTE